MRKVKDFVCGELSGWKADEIAWMVFCLASITGLSLWWQEPPTMIVAAVSGMMYTLLAGKGKASCYLFGLVNAPLYMYASWQEQYYGDVALNGFYLLMMLPGFMAWQRNRHAGNPGAGVKKTALSAMERWLWLGGMTLATFVLGVLLMALDGAYPLCDAATNVLSIAAMILTVKRCVEQWPLWIAVDLIEVFMWYKVDGDGEVSLLLMWLLFLANGCILGWRWCRELKREREMSTRQSVVD